MFRSNAKRVFTYDALTADSDKAFTGRLMLAPVSFCSERASLSLSLLAPIFLYFFVLPHSLLVFAKRNSIFEIWLMRCIYKDFLAHKLSIKKNCCELKKEERLLFCYRDRSVKSADFWAIAIKMFPWKNKMSVLYVQLHTCLSKST